MVWDKTTGQPIANAIVWQSRQSSPIADQLKADGHTEMIHEKTGLVIDAYFSATKVRWLLDNIEGAQERRIMASYFSERSIHGLCGN